MGVFPPYSQSPFLGVQGANTYMTTVLFMKKYSMMRKATTAAQPTDAEVQPEELRDQPELEKEGGDALSPAPTLREKDVAVHGMGTNDDSVKG